MRSTTTSKSRRGIGYSRHRTNNNNAENSRNIMRADGDEEEGKGEHETVDEEECDEWSNEMGAIMKMACAVVTIAFIIIMFYVFIL